MIVTFLTRKPWLYRESSEVSASTGLSAQTFAVRSGTRTRRSAGASLRTALEPGENLLLEKGLFRRVPNLFGDRLD